MTIEKSTNVATIYTFTVKSRTQGPDPAGQKFPDPDNPPPLKKIVSLIYISTVSIFKKFPNQDNPPHFQKKSNCRSNIYISSIWAQIKIEEKKVILVK